MYSLSLGPCLRSLKDGYPQIEGYSNLLEIAQDGGNYDLVQLFIQYGEDLNCINDFNPLKAASERNQLEIIELLLSNGVDIDICSLEEGNETPLMKAAEFGFIEVVKILLDHGANLNFKNIEGNSALAYASYSDEKDIIDLLVEYGADVNITDNQSWTLLMKMVSIGNLELVKHFISLGININAIGENGITAFDLALQENEVLIAMLLLEHGACPSLKINLNDDVNQDKKDNEYEIQELETIEAEIIEKSTIDDSLD